ncbi:MAG: hypothetical protein A2176_07980 [Spirochaetes bacterium RBG_13_51_14]|nr:MAG: hypothetical protein A2176_07980 [Spirochaetes bacterium RBG_13_51_14]
MKTGPYNIIVSLKPRRAAKRLYGKSLVRNGASSFMKKLVLSCILILPVIAAGINATCLRQTRHGAADPYWNDVSRYLAGLEIGESSVLLPLTKEPRYKEHVRFMNDLWSMIQKETIDLIVPWRQEHIPSMKRSSVALYPLSGADFINLYAMFPDARTYLMIALEQPGEVEALRDYGSQRLIDGLMPIHRSIYMFGVNNYFQTKVMYREMNNTLLPGISPVLLIFMARLGLTIRQVENITLGESGSIAPHAEAPAAEHPGRRISGVRIRFTGQGVSRPRELVYLSMRLEANSVDPSTPEGRFLNSLHNVRTMLKSAVYILQTRRYEPLRDFILQRSRLIVQDDSGIAYGAFDEKWDVKLFGTYWPYLQLGGCSVVVQNDLLQSYRKESRPLPFNFGYGIILGRGKSNLLVAKKK